MADDVEVPPFQVVVSDRKEVWIGEGASRRKADACIFYFAEKKEGDPIYIQALNQHQIPAGEKKFIDAKDFIQAYRPEPLIYYNTVKPSMERLDETVEKAEKLKNNEKYDRAEEMYQEALKMDEDNVRAIFGLGITYLSTGNLEEAEKIFEKIVSVEHAFEPEHKHLFNEFGIKLRKCKMHEQGISYYQSAIECCPKDENLYFNLGRIYYEIEEHEKGLEVLCTCMDLAPEFEIAGKLKAAFEKKLAPAEEKTEESREEQPEAAEQVAA